MHQQPPRPQMPMQQQQQRPPQHVMPTTPRWEPPLCQYMYGREYAHTEAAASLQGLALAMMKREPYQKWDLHLKPPELRVRHISRPGPVPLSCRACCCRQPLGAPAPPVQCGSAPRMLSPRSMPPGARPLKSPARPYQPIQPGQPAQVRPSSLVSLPTPPPPPPPPPQSHSGASRPANAHEKHQMPFTAAGVSWCPCQPCAGNGVGSGMATSVPCSAPALKSSVGCRLPSKGSQLI